MMKVLSLPTAFYSLDAMERALVEHWHRHFRALGSRFEPTCVFAQVLNRPLMSSLMEGQSSLVSHVRIHQ